MKIKMIRIDPITKETQEIFIDGFNAGDSVRVQLEDENGKTEDIAWLKISKNKNLSFSK